MFYRFAQPWLLLFLLLLPAMAAWRLLRHRRPAALRFSQTAPLKAAQTRSAEWSRYLLLGLRMLAVGLVVVALARPQSGLQGEEVKTEGIDIALAIDISSSMLAEDIEPNRAEAAKEVAIDFIRRRVNDRIGLVIFSGQAYTQCPLTLDYDVLVNLFDEVKVGMIEDGTAIGMGLGLAVNRLKESSAKSKVIILLTDGRNNRGEIDPRTAAELARTFGIRVYTIGAGRKGTARYPVNDPLFGKRYAQIEVDIDEDLLREIASKTGGQYFRATDRASLDEIYRQIDQLEKTEIAVTEYTRYAELFHYPLGLALLLVLVEIALSSGRLRKIP